MKQIIRISLLLSLLLVVFSCSRNKDIITSRLYHRMVSQYNILFNGQQALIKAKQTLEDSHEEDFDEILPVFIIGTEQAVSSVKPDLEKAIEKGTKVISNHSMMIRNEQENTYIDDSYMLIGKARYYDRDYLKALETFNYVIQEFKDDPDIRLEAEYWAARTETALGNYLNAKDRFERIYRDEELPNKLKDDVFAAYAQLEIDNTRKTNAYQLITQAIDRADEKEQEVRWLYIAAQLQEELGNDYEASNLFLKVIKKGPPYELLFNAQLSRARSYDVDLQDPEDVYDELEDMLADEKNYDNRDKIYYVMAEVADKMDDERQVIYFLNQSIRTSTQNLEQKALSYLWLAEINFDYKEYETSQAYYDSSFQNLPKDHPRYEKVKALKESLGQLVENLKNIALQDSLQMLSGMSENQRMRIVDQIIEEEKEKQRQKELEEQRAEMDKLAFNTGGGGSDGPAAMAGTAGEKQKFYFYNTNLRSGGVSDFNQRWGNRKLEDNWRRKDKASNPGGAGASSDDGALAAGGEGPGEEGDGEKDPRFQPETYLTNIPETEEELKASHEIIQNALYDNGLLYKEEIEDYLAAEESLDEILERYPEYENKARVWYTLYRIFVISENEKEAERYKNLILTNYPDSEYAYLIKNEGKEKDSTAVSVIKDHYTKAYNSFEQKNYRSSLRQSTEGYDQYPNSEYGPMFLLLKALNYGYLKEQEKYVENLNHVVNRYPKTEQGKRASQILGQVAPAGENEGGDQNNKKTVNYRTDFSSMHRYVVIFPNKKASANDITIKLTDFSRKYYPNDPLRAKTILLGENYQLVTVSGLPNKSRALQFLQTINNEKVLEQELLSIDFKQFVISNSNFTNFYTNQDIEGYMNFFKEHYKD